MEPEFHFCPGTYAVKADSKDCSQSMYCHTGEN